MITQYKPLAEGRDEVMSRGLKTFFLLNEILLDVHVHACMFKEF